MAGVPCIRDLRMPVATVVGMVADGMTVEILGQRRARSGDVSYESDERMFATE